MKNLLENVIRTFLFEARTVGKIKSLSQKELKAAQATGAVWAYSVLVKGTSNPTEILDLVNGATDASTGSDTESRVAVGKSSKFANGEYWYVVAEPKAENRQLVLVRIMPKLQEPSANVKVDSEATSTARIRVFKSPMMTETTYNATVKKYNEIGNTKYDELESMTLTNDTDDKETSNDVVNDSPKVKGYPFDWTTSTGTFKVYTKSPQDSFIYVKGDKWYWLDKTEFETNYTDATKIGSALTPLDQEQVDIIEKQFGLQSNTQTNITPDTKNIVQTNTAKDTKNNKQGNTNNTVKQNNTGKPSANKLKVEKLNAAKAKNKNTAFIDLSKTPVYYFKNSKWEEAGNYDPADNQYILYLGSSSDYKYVRVKFIKDQQTAWVPTSAVK